MKILILYATRRGSTGEVAEYIANILREHEFSVDIANVEGFDGDMTQYDAYLFGTNIYNGMWNHALTERVRLSLDSIAKKPVWGWGMCIRILEDGSEPYLRLNYIPANLVSKLNLQGFRFFAGKLLFEDIDLDERWTLAVRYDGTRDPTDFNGDFRNWDKIKAWAQEVAVQMQQFS